MVIVKGMGIPPVTQANGMVWFLVQFLFRGSFPNHARMSNPAARVHLVFVGPKSKVFVNMYPFMRHTSRTI